MWWIHLLKLLVSSFFCYCDICYWCPHHHDFMLITCTNASQVKQDNDNKRVLLYIVGTLAYQYH